MLLDLSRTTTCPSLFLALLGAAAEALATVCLTEADCAFAGDCLAGRCQCDVTWHGPNCTELALLPATSSDAAGLRRNRSSSWGASVLFDNASGEYYMFFADMAQHCGLNAWQTNSQISVARSTNPTGPFAVVPGSPPIAPPFAHNPTVHGPAPDGFYVIYHIGSGQPSSHGSPRTDCTNGTTPAKHASLALEPPATMSPAAPTILFSKSVTGPWYSALLAIEAVPGPGSQSAARSTVGCNNPAASFLKNGTVLLVCKVSVTPPNKWRQMAVYSASHWRGPYSFRRLTPVYGEDPYLLRRRIVHSLAAALNCFVLEFCTFMLIWFSLFRPGTSGMTHAAMHFT